MSGMHASLYLKRRSCWFISIGCGLKLSASGRQSRIILIILDETITSTPWILLRWVHLRGHMTPRFPPSPVATLHQEWTGFLEQGMEASGISGADTTTIFAPHSLLLCCAHVLPLRQRTPHSSARPARVSPAAACATILASHRAALEPRRARRRGTPQAAPGRGRAFVRSEIRALFAAYLVHGRTV